MTFSFELSYVGAYVRVWVRMCSYVRARARARVCVCPLVSNQSQNNKYDLKRRYFFFWIQ